MISTALETILEPQPDTKGKHMPDYQEAMTTLESLRSTASQDAADRKSLAWRTRQLLFALDPDALVVTTNEWEELRGAADDARLMFAVGLTIGAVVGGAVAGLLAWIF